MAGPLAPSINFRGPNHSLGSRLGHGHGRDLFAGGHCRCADLTPSVTVLKRTTATGFLGLEAGKLVLKPFLHYYSLHTTPHAHHRGDATRHQGEELP